MEKPTIGDKMSQFKYAIAIVLVAVLITASAANVYSVSPSNVATYNKWTTVNTLTYTIFTDGTNYYAKNGATGAIDSSGTDVATVIQYAIDHTTAGIIHVNAGTYNLTTGITINKNNVTLEGDGENSTVFSVSGSLTAITLKNGSTPVFWSKVRMIQIQFTGSFDASRMGIYTDQCRSCELSNIQISSGNTSGAGTGIKLDASTGFGSYTQLTKLKVSGQFNTGLLITGNAVSTNNGNICIACSFVGITPAQPNSIGVNIDKGDTNSFFDVSVESMVTAYKINDQAARFFAPRLEGITTGFNITSSATNLIISGPSFATTTTQYSSLQPTSQVIDAAGVRIGDTLLKRLSSTQIQARNSTDTGSIDIVANKFKATDFEGNPSASLETGSTAGSVLLKTHNASSALTTRVTISGNTNQATMTLGATNLNMNGNLFQSIRSGSADPTTSDIPSGFWTLWKNTTSGTIKLWYNDAGSLKSVALS